MKESHDQDLARQIDPESCAAAREGVGEALTGANAGRSYSLESVAVPDADAHLAARKATSTVWSSPGAAGDSLAPKRPAWRMARPDRSSQLVQSVHSARPA